LTALRGDVDLSQHWSRATRDSAGIAPAPGEHPEALVLVYGARAYNWRGLFAVHTWIATKDKGAPYFLVHDVVGWRALHGQPVLSTRPDIPDRIWFGNPPQLIAELRGSAAQQAIAKIAAANARYVHDNRYRMWPGPNSNTYTAHIARLIPELGAVLPATAIGKDYFTDDRWLGPTPSGTGIQISARGLLGVAVGLQEGFEVNLLGAVFGIDFLRPALKLPGIGRIGIHRPPSRASP
jgi:hypothetical protein